MQQAVLTGRAPPRSIATMQPTPSAADEATVPRSGEFTAAWIAYGLYGLGAFLMWPTLIGLIVCYVKRDTPGAGFINSHYRWLIRVFWWSLAGCVICILAILVGAWPLIVDTISEVIRTDGNIASETQLDITVGKGSLVSITFGAIVGGIGLAIVWLAYLVCIIRGIVRLGGAHAV